MGVMVIENETERAGVINPEEAVGYMPWFDIINNGGSILCWVSQSVQNDKRDIANISEIHMSDAYYPKFFSPVPQRMRMPYDEESNYSCDNIFIVYKYAVPLTPNEIKEFLSLSEQIWAS